MGGSRLSLLGWHAMALAILAAVLAIPCPAQQSQGTGSPPLFPPAPIQTSQPPPSEGKPPIPSASLNDLAWLQGQWNGMWGPRSATQVWSAPHAGTMLGTLQIVEDDKTTVVEFVTINDTPDGLEYRVLHFKPSLAPWEKSGPAVLSLMTIDPKRIVFQNRSDGEPQQIVLTRTDPDTYTNRWEILPETGDTLTNEIIFHRQKPNAGNAAHR